MAMHIDQLEFQLASANDGEQARAIARAIAGQTAEFDMTIDQLTIELPDGADAPADEIGRRILDRLRRVAEGA